MRKHKIKLIPGDDYDLVSSAEMKIGDIMEIRSTLEQYNGCHFLRTYSNYVLLESPSVTFSGAANKFEGRIVKPGEKLLITIL